MWLPCLLMKICNYQSHPYLMWKSFNVVWMTISSNILQYYFCQTFPYIFQTLDIIFNIVHYENPRPKLFCQNLLMFLHGVIIRSILCGRANVAFAPLSIYPMADLHSKILDTPLPHLGPFFFCLPAGSRKIWPNNRLAPPMGLVSLSGKPWFRPWLNANFSQCNELIPSESATCCFQNQPFLNEIY